MKESTRIQTKYAYVKGYISIETLIKTFAKGKFTIKPEHIKWLNSDKGRKQAIEDYNNYTTMGATQAKSRRVNEQWEKSKKIFTND